MSGRRPFTETEFTLLNTVSDSRTKTLLLCGALTGFRISELLSWTVGDLFLQGAIRDKVTVKAEFMKNKKKQRAVKLHPLIQQLLIRTVTDTTSLDSYIFRSQKGRNKAICVSTACRNVKNLCLSHGITGRIGTHTMRKTYAQLLYKASGNDIIVVQIALGHRNVSTTMQYLEIDGGRIDAVMGVMW
jgi:integrase